MSHRLAEVLFANRLIDSADEHSDSSESSRKSEENSHIPLKNLNIPLENLSLEEKNMMEQNTGEGNFFQQLTNQLAELTQSITTMSVKQAQYDNMLANINRRLGDNAVGAVQH